jgi:cellobiose-specific phosphotransferase system component IIA
VAAVLAIVVAVGEARSTTSVALMAAARETVETAATIIRMVEVPATSRAAGIAV